MTGAVEMLVMKSLSEKQALATKAQLWDGIKEYLSRWSTMGGFDKPNLPNETLVEFWEMMQRREEQA